MIVKEKENRNQIEIFSIHSLKSCSAWIIPCGWQYSTAYMALTQLGNVGGEPYWSWYGFGSRVEWCACFVSWCADQCGYIEIGVCPKYA